MNPNTSDASVEREISASPDVLWAMVSDITRMGEWSPETTAGKWLGEATETSVGAKFQGSNKLKKLKWKTTCTVTACEPGKVFAFESKGGPMRIARWTYSFEATDEGCRVIESWTDQRSKFNTFLSGVISGVKDRKTHNLATMEKSLENLAKAAES